MAEDQDLDALVRRTDPDRWLSSRFIEAEGRRADVVAIYAYDYELARAPKVASNALLGEIVSQVESIELAGPYKPWMTTVGHGPIRQPIKLQFA